MDSAESFNEKGEKISNGGFLTKRNKSSVINPTFMETRSIDDDMEIQYPGSEK
jgi:GTP-binding protein